jgi:hypothetical protein
MKPPDYQTGQAPSPPRLFGTWVAVSFMIGGRIPSAEFFGTELIHYTSRTSEIKGTDSIGDTSGPVNS